MPQFDTFPFFSQLFWVFLHFITLYLIFSFNILPALSIALKIRNHKLNISNASNELTTAVANNSNLSVTSSIETKTNSVISDYRLAHSNLLETIKFDNIMPKLNLCVLKVETNLNIKLASLNKMHKLSFFVNRNS